MLTCKEAMRNLSSYLNRTLPHDLDQEVGSHLWHCEECPRITKICDVWVLQEPKAPAPKAPPMRMVPPKQARARASSRRSAARSA